MYRFHTHTTHQFEVNAKPYANAHILTKVPHSIMIATAGCVDALTDAGSATELSAAQVTNHGICLR